MNHFIPTNWTTRRNLSYIILRNIQPTKIESQRNRKREHNSSNKEIESVTKNLQIKWGTDRFTGKIYQTFNEEITPMLLKLFKEMQELEMLSNLFYEVWYQDQIRIPQERKIIGYSPDKLKYKHPQ